MDISHYLKNPKLMIGMLRALTMNQLFKILTHEKVWAGNAMYTHHMGNKISLDPSYMVTNFSLLLQSGIDDDSADKIVIFADIINEFAKKKIGYCTSEELFEVRLDRIFAV